MGLLVVFLIFFLLLSAFFSGMEMAFISSSKLKIELSKTQGKTAGKALSYFIKNPSRFISTYLVGNNIALVLYGLLLGQLLKPIWQDYFPQQHFLALLIETIIGTVIVLIFGEFFPKLLFRLNADKMLHKFALPFTFFHFILFLPVIFVNWVTKLFMKLFFKIDLDETEQVFSEVDLENYIKENFQKTDNEEVDAELLENALDLKDVKVRQCFVPRLEVTAIDVNSSIEDLRKTIIESGFSKIVVYRENINNVLGYVHHFDIHKNPKKIANIIKPIPVVPETMYAQQLLTEFKHGGRTIALVVDEYGETAGIVTFEDILEEIFGEIHDEHDDEDFIEEQLAVNEYLFSGRLEIDYINEEYGLELPEGEYETLSGYIIFLEEDIPELSETIETDNHIFKILNVSTTKIQTIKVIKKGYI